MTVTNDTSARESWQDFRDRRNAGLAEPYGWLTPVALHWLSEDAERFDHIPGEWRFADGEVHLDLAPGEALEHGETALRGAVKLDPNYTRLRYGQLDIEIISRSGLAALRIRDPEAPTRTAFNGVPVFDFDPTWIIRARYIPDETLGHITLGSVSEGISHSRLASGRVRFEREGKPVELVVTHASAGPQLLFRDLTSGVETYPALRSLDVKLPEQGSEVVLDFNRAVNLPCAFTDFCTCPLAPAENSLPFAVRAGEKSPAAH